MRRGAGKALAMWNPHPMMLRPCGKLPRRRDLLTLSILSACAIAAIGCGGGDEPPRYGDGRSQTSRSSATATSTTSGTTYSTAGDATTTAEPELPADDPDAPNGIPIEEYPDACKVLPLAEVERVMGASATAEGLTTIIGDVTLPKPLTCVYMFEDAGIGSARFDISGVFLDEEEAQRQFDVGKKIGVGENLEPIPGLGDEAYQADLRSTQVNVLSGVYAYSVQVGFENRWRREAVALAQVADRNLEQQD